MLQHNVYFDGLVQSLGYERHGRRQSVGVIAPGTHTFDTGAAERMTVISGQLLVTLSGQTGALHYPAGTSFEIAENSSFTVEVTAPTAYLCEYF